MQTGTLLLFDVSGYTEFLTRTDLEQAPGILGSLLGTLVEHVAPPLVVAELEGDAVFAYVPDGAFEPGELLLREIERLYSVFCAAREQMKHSAACDCAGCRQFPALDLKVVAHHGRFALTRIAKGQNAKPVGADVVLAHRLLKNAIAARTGLRAYAFITEACARALALDRLGDRAIRHTESYEHVGDVPGFVLDLEPVWAAERGRRLVAVEPGEAWLEVETEIAAPLRAVWERVASPRFRALWRRADRITPAVGRTLSAAEQQCHQGEVVAVERILDWRPFERVTLECEWPLAPRVRITTELSGSPIGTRLIARLAPEPGGGRTREAFARTWFRLRGDAVAAQCRSNLEQLKAWVLQERDGAGSAGGVPAAPPIREATT